jgi:hypothetical protein
MRAARPGAGHFLRGRAYCNKELCCLLQRRAMVGFEGCRGCRLGGGCGQHGQADGQAGRHTSGGDSGR